VQVAGPVLIDGYAHIETTSTMPLESMGADPRRSTMFNLANEGMNYAHSFEHDLGGNVWAWYSRFELY
jgi:hypothetical protein